MKNLFFSFALITIFLGLFSGEIYAQSSGVAVNTVGVAADPSAMLDVSSSTQGILIPRVILTSTTVAAPVVNPANSLMVYNTNTAGDVTPGFYYWDGAQWVRLVSGASLNADLEALKTMIYTNVGGH